MKECFEKGEPSKDEIEGKFDKCLEDVYVELRDKIKVGNLIRTKMIMMILNFTAKCVGIKSSNFLSKKDSPDEKFIKVKKLMKIFFSGYN